MSFYRFTKVTSFPDLNYRCQKVQLSITIAPKNYKLTLKLCGSYLCGVNTSQPIVLFDGVCNFCNNMVNFAIRNDKDGRLKFAPLQSDTGKNLLATYGVSPVADTVVFIKNGKVYTYASAAIHISRYLNWPAKMLYIFIIIPPFITQPIYKWFAKRRYKWFGKKETCMIPTKEVRERFLD